MPQLNPVCTICTNEVIAFAFEWQTLIVGGAAVIAAVITVTKMKTQIEHQRSQYEGDKNRHDEIQRRKERAARAELPDALSAICKYTTGCLNYLLGEDDIEEKPNVPTDAINVVKICIEYVAPEPAQKLNELIVHYQITNSRLSNHHRTEKPRENVDRMYDVVCLRALTDRMFEYARNREESESVVKFSHSDMISALRSCAGISEYFDDEDRYSSVTKIIDQKHSDHDSSDR